MCANHMLCDIEISGRVQKYVIKGGDGLMVISLYPPESMTENIYSHKQCSNFHKIERSLVTKSKDKAYQLPPLLLQQKM